MKYEAKNYDGLLGTPGFSEKLLKDHFELYKGYVKNVNTVYDTLNEFFRKKKTGSPEYNEVRRRFGWEFNGMRLHELYFGNLSKKGSPLDPESDLLRKMTEEFGSYKQWEQDFKDVAALRGIGWVILYYDQAADLLLNCWINEHDLGHLAGASPILVLDVFEHAYISDYGVKKDGYISAFFQALAWNEADARFDQAISKQAELAGAAR